MTEWKLGVLDGVLGALSFWHGTADVLTRYARDEWLTDEEQRRLQLAAFAGMRIGEQLLRAENAEDHEERIFKAVGQFELMSLSALGFRWTLKEGFDATIEYARKPVLPDLFDVFGRGAIPSLKEADTLSAVVAICMTQRRCHAGGQDVWIQAEDMLKFLCDPALPRRRFGLAFAHAGFGAACFMAMAHAVLTRREVRPVIAATLAEHWLAGTRQMVWLLASMPGVRVPPELVPHGLRFDVERLLADLEAGREPAPIPAGFDPPLPPPDFGPPTPPWLSSLLLGFGLPPAFGPPPGFGPPLPPKFGPPLPPGFGPPPSAVREPKS